MIQDIFPHKLNNHYDPARKPQGEDYVISYRHQSMLVKVPNGKELLFPKVSEWNFAEELVYLFEIDEKGFFLDASLEDRTGWTENGFSYVGMRELRSRTLSPQEYVYAAYTAMHLAEWYIRKQYCGVCGSKLRHDTVERAMYCENCGAKYYPRINPAVIVGVKNGDKLLLTKYREGFRHNALIAGFTEIGETLEETVAREVMEEAGIHVKNIRYYKSQPWGIASDLLAGFYCDVDGDPTIHMDCQELRYAEWVQREEIELQPQDYSLTNEMMKRFKEGKEV